MSPDLTPPHPSPFLDEITRLYAAGHTLREIAAVLASSEETVRRAMVSAGITRRPRGQPVGKHLPSGGSITDKDGYVLRRVEGHPYANSTGYVREHRLVMEEAIGRYLHPREVVHHLNGNREDNRLENLQLFESDSASKERTLQGNQRASGDIGNPKRSVRTCRTPEEIIQALQSLAGSLGRPIQRTDLVPPNPSWRAVARVFGTWQNGVSIALGASTPRRAG